MLWLVLTAKVDYVKKDYFKSDRGPQRVFEMYAEMSNSELLNLLLEKTVYLSQCLI